MASTPGFKPSVLSGLSENVTDTWLNIDMKTINNRQTGRREGPKHASKSQGS